MAKTIRPWSICWPEMPPPSIDWLTEAHGLPFSVVDDFDYPGHSSRRMHGLPTRAGAELIDALRSAAERAGIDIVCERRAETLYFAESLVHGVAARRPDGEVETIGCKRLILACNGFGGNRALVARHMPADRRRAVVRPRWQPR